MSFTAEEAWGYIPGKKEHESVFLAQWYDWTLDINSYKSQDTKFTEWELYLEPLLIIRKTIQKEIENLRIKGFSGIFIRSRGQFIFC